MSLLDEKITALFRRGSPKFNGAELAPSVERPVVEKAASETVVIETAIEEAIATRVDDQPTSASQGTMAAQTSSLWTGLDLDSAIRLRWALRDIKAKRTKLTPVSSSDLKTLMEMGLIEMRGDAPMLNKVAYQALNR
jgi:hypothetical protein